MLENLTETDQVEDFKILAAYVNGESKFPQTRIIMGAQDWFRARNYKVVEPYQKKDYSSTQRHIVCEFFNHNNIFKMKVGDLVDTFLSTRQKKQGLQTSITTIKVRDESIKSGIGSIFFGDVVQYISETTHGINYSAGYMVVQQYQGLNPHGFYKKLGFVAAPKVLESWIIDDSDLTFCSLEQFYSSRAQKFDEERQDVKSDDSEQIFIPDYKSICEVGSAKSTSRRDKHCHYGKCDGKLQRGIHWARHLTKVRQVEGKLGDSLYSLCSGTDKCGSCIKLKSTVVSKAKDPSPNKMDVHQVQRLKPMVICTPCINKKEGKGSQGNSYFKSSEISETIKPQVLEVQEDDVNAYREDQEVIKKYETLLRRPSLDAFSVSPISFNNTTADTTDMRMQIDTTRKQGQLTFYNTLKMIGRSKEKVVLLADSVLDVCHLFVCEYAEQYIQNNKCKQLIDCINLLLDHVDTLTHQSMIGLVTAAFIIGQSCWQSVVSTLNIKTPENRESLMQKFSLYVTIDYDMQAAKWFKQYWKYSTDQHIDQCRYFKISDTKNKELIKKQQVHLEQSFIAQWLEILEAEKTTVNIADVISIQHFLNELQQKYRILTYLQDDITQIDDDRFTMILDSIDIKPNSKQFALAQYCVAKLYSSRRQLWVIHSGQGKSRISASNAMITLLCGSVTRIHMVFPNEELKERDRADFQNLFLFQTEGEDMISYHVGIDFIQIDNSLIIVDEANYFMFEDPPKFKLFLQNSPYICFTATPANSIVEKNVAAELKFEQYSYSLNDDTIIDKSGALMVDVNYKASALEEKANNIKELAKSTPVLVYCNEELTKAIVTAGIPPVMIEAGVDQERLRQLGKLNADTQNYTIVVSEQMFGVPGFDNRSESISMTLIIAKSFWNRRDAVQIFTEWEASETIAAGFMNAMKIDYVVLKPVVVKKATTKYKGKSAKRQNQLLKE
ncbi:UNKNOWN [Stylonychia lemnae]|uniref:Uncharacterized protein n=1 Tax=Stylonychia lemnae TaxID=5949 RepID=A0A078ABF8_STYLE|nr:UNKNOWN [Stylonychia lemnae]|eukprot:CDW79640.1 UNKNOWN [Stylonychia lemnae]